MYLQYKYSNILWNSKSTFDKFDVVRKVTGDSQGQITAWTRRSGCLDLQTQTQGQITDGTRPGGSLDLQTQTQGQITDGTRRSGFLDLQTQRSMAETLQHSITTTPDRHRKVVRDIQKKLLVGGFARCRRLTTRTSSSYLSELAAASCSDFLMINNELTVNSEEVVIIKHQEFLVNLLR